MSRAYILIIRIMSNYLIGEKMKNIFTWLLLATSVPTFATQVVTCSILCKVVNPDGSVVISSKVSIAKNHKEAFLKLSKKCGLDDWNNDTYNTVIRFDREGRADSHGTKYVNKSDCDSVTL